MLLRGRDKCDAHQSVQRKHGFEAVLHTLPIINVTQGVFPQSMPEAHGDNTVNVLQLNLHTMRFCVVKSNSKVISMFEQVCVLKQLDKIL